MHADDTSTGASYEECGRAFFADLNEVGVLVVAVPDNHNPLACTQRLTDDLENVIVAHRRLIDSEAPIGDAVIEYRASHV